MHLIWCCDFLGFRISEKMGEFSASIERSKAKSVSASGGLCPPTPFPDQGLCPWTPLGALPPDPRYRLALQRSPWPPIYQILNTPLIDDVCLFVTAVPCNNREQHRLPACRMGWKKQERQSNKWIITQKERQEHKKNTLWRSNDAFEWQRLSVIVITNRDVESHNGALESIFARPIWGENFWFCILN